MDEPRTIADYLKCSIDGIIQDGKNYAYSKVDYNTGVRRLRIASILLSKGYPVETVPHELINAWGGLENVPDYNAFHIENPPEPPVKKSSDMWHKDKKKVMYFNCEWNKEIIQLPIDVLQRIPQAGDFLDMGIYLWRGEELKQTYIPGNENSFYYVTRVFIGLNYVRVDVQRYADYIQELKNLPRPEKRRR